MIRPANTLFGFAAAGRATKVSAAIRSDDTMMEALIVVDATRRSACDRCAITDSALLKQCTDRVEACTIGSARAIDSRGDLDRTSRKGAIDLDKLRTTSQRFEMALNGN